MILVALCSVHKTTQSPHGDFYRFGKTVGKFMWILNISHAINVRFLTSSSSMIRAMQMYGKGMLCMLFIAFENVLIEKGVYDFIWRQFLL